MRIQPIKLGVAAFLAILIAFSGVSLSEEPDGDFVEWRQGLQYTVQKGDTLWDLSEKFFDTPAMWPELWKQNPHIKNPHWIEPGTIVNLFIEDGVAFIPKPVDPPEPEAQPEEVVEVESPKPPAYYYPKVNRACFVRKEYIESFGEVTSILSGGVMASSGEVLFVRLTSDEKFAEGDRFTIWRPTRKIKNEFKGKMRKSLVGTLHWIVGEAVCLQTVDGTMEVRIEDSYRDIRVGDRLMAYRNLPANIEIRPGVPDMKGRIVGQEDHKEVFGEGDIVFIDKGADADIEIGQVYDIFTTEEVKTKGNGRLFRNGEETVVHEVLMGKLIVLIVEDNNSTALILESKNDLRIGACFQTKKFLKR